MRIFVIGEALTIGFLSGAIGLLVSYPIVQFVLSRSSKRTWAPGSRTSASTPSRQCLAVVLSVVLAAVASLIPARQASQLSVTDALRRVG